MDPVTPTRARRSGWILHLALLAALLSGPATFSRLISGATSLLTWPLTRELAFEANRFEIRNAALLLVYVVAVLGLNMAFRSGLIILGHSAPFLFGAYILAITTVELGWSYWLGLLLAGVVTGAIGILLGLPSLRLGAMTFGMVTLGYAYIAVDLTYQWRSITRGGDNFTGITAPGGLAEVESYYWLLVAVVVVAYAVCHNLLRSPYGRGAKAVSGNQVAAGSIGVNVQAVRLWTYAFSAMFAGFAGGLYAGLIRTISPDAFTVSLTVLFVTMVLLGGWGTLGGPLLGAFVLVRLPIAIDEVSDQSAEVSLLVYGVALLVTVWLAPKGLMSGWFFIRERFLRRRGEEADPGTPTLDISEVVAPAEREAGSVVLRVDAVRKNLGGVQALDGVDLELRAGTVHGLIGPNGSGKTTLLNVLFGYVVPDEGDVEVLGRSAVGARPYQQARRGVGRTFQTPYVFEEMSCLENVLSACDLRRRGRLPAYLLRLPSARREERENAQHAIDLLRAVGLEHRLDAAAGDLPPGERRLVEIARVLALRPQLVLMDEPAAGLTSSEIDSLEVAVRTLRDAGIAVLFVEHHVSLVMRMADEVTVLDAGRCIAHGTSQEVQDDPKVIEAYLGARAVTDEETTVGGPS